MSVSSELLCSFELLKPLDSSQLKSHIKKGRNKRANMLNSPVSRCSLSLLHYQTNFDCSLRHNHQWPKAFDNATLSSFVRGGN